MNLRDYANYLREDGHKIIETDGHYWVKKAPFYYSLVPEFRPVVIGANEVSKIKEKACLVLIFPTNELPTTEISLHVCENKGYSLADIQSRTRSHTRRGLERSKVEQLEFEYLRKQGVAINKAALKRQGRKRWNPVLTNQALWEQRMRVCSRYDDVRAYGSFVDGNLAAYIVTCIIEDHCIIQSAMSHSDYLKSYPNNALIFVAVREMFQTQNVNEVSFGFKPMDEKLMRFKLHMGFELRPIPYRITINPLVKPFLRFSKKFRHYVG